MARRRIEKDPAAVESPWDKLLSLDTRERRERGGYAEACELDKVGRYEEADEALRVAGIREDVIQDRRRHLEWRLREGYSVTGDTLTRVKPKREIVSDSCATDGDQSSKC